MRSPERIADGPVGGPGGRSRWTDIDGLVHYLDFGGPANSALIVAVHGLGGAAVNWCAIAPKLTRRYRLLAPDLAGHGLTKSGNRGTDVASNTTLLHRFTESVADGPVVLMGNSMGGMIALLEARAAPAKVAGLILVDPALPFQPVRLDPLVTAVFALSATPVLGPLLARQRRFLPVESMVASTLAVCCADASRVPPEIVAQHIEVATKRAAMDGNGKDFAHAARSVIETAGFLHGQAYRRGIRDVRCPVLLVHGERDRLIPVAAARMAAKAHPDWTLTVLPDVGHVPQLEAPEETASAVTAWLRGAGALAAKAATPKRKRRSQPQRLRQVKKPA
ncbi:MAG TPA: alpha/beta hydrolase [Streptosporangiaceae bacterium]|nr:alpha/beta hydrolase [Streptosporangiaceae bacterium]